MIVEPFGLIIRKGDLVSAEWSGGVTTQLAIYPEGASYATRDFAWRVSTATVEAESSEFTLLPGVARILMVLEGEMRLVHDGVREVALGRFGQDSFDGGSHTESFGRVRDFNLMMGEGCTGSVEALELLADGRSRLHAAEGVVDGASFTAIAAEDGNVLSEVYFALTKARLTQGGVSVELAPGDVYITGGGKAPGGTPTVKAPGSMSGAQTVKVWPGERPAIIIRAAIIQGDYI